jgi:hypothetical protein
MESERQSAATRVAAWHIGIVCPIRDRKNAVMFYRAAAVEYLFGLGGMEVAT